MDGNILNLIFFICFFLISSEIKNKNKYILIYKNKLKINICLNE